MTPALITINNALLYKEDAIFITNQRETGEKNVLQMKKKVSLKNDVRFSFVKLY